MPDVWMDGPTPEVWSPGAVRRIELGWRAASRLSPPFLDMRWWYRLAADAWGTK